MSTTYASSYGGTVRDLDGFSLQGEQFSGQGDFSNNYSVSTTRFQADSDDFGFDPAPQNTRMYNTSDDQFTPPGDRDCDLNFGFDPAKGASRTIQLNDALPNTNSAVLRHGQVTPPRSNSESSIDKIEQKSTRQKRAAKTQVKEEQPASTRKRRNTRKSSTATTGSPEEDDKRKQSLEKNRLAAAKCRVNKKEKTEQLQRDSHDKAVQNAFLKEQVMRMKEEVQQMNAVLLQHANCEGCKSPEDISRHLSNLGNDFYTQHIGVPEHHAFEFGNGEMEYFSPATDTSMMNTSLPDFDRGSDFNISTPMHTD